MELALSEYSDGYVPFQVLRKSEPIKMLIHNYQSDWVLF